MQMKKRQRYSCVLWLGIAAMGLMGCESTQKMSSQRSLSRSTPSRTLVLPGSLSRELASRSGRIAILSTESRFFSRNDASQGRQATDRDSALLFSITQIRDRQWSINGRNHDNLYIRTYSERISSDR